MNIFVPWAILAHVLWHLLSRGEPEHTEYTWLGVRLLTDGKKKNDPRHLLHFTRSSFMTQVQRGDHSSLIKTPEHNVTFSLLIEELSWICCLLNYPLIYSFPHLIVHTPQQTLEVHLFLG